MALNVEIKARCKDPQKIRRILKSQKAEFKGVDHQIDTYFKVSSGRLKLRQGNIECALIAYNREDTKDPKPSNFNLYQPQDLQKSEDLKAVLVKSLGIKVVVDKQREIYFIDNVKFHVDEVKDLGTFIEIEARDMNGTFNQNELLAHCQRFMELFGIKEGDLLASSYSDILLEK
jgi:adenylate cyclase, class 2